MRELRHAVGLRALSSGQVASVAKEAKTALPSFKQYREKDGLFYFKLVDAKGQALLRRARRGVSSNESPKGPHFQAARGCHV